MSSPAKFLIFFGRSGTTLLLFAIAAGLLIPELANAFKPLIPVALSILTLGSFLVASFTAAAPSQRYVVFVIIWVAAAPSLICAFLLRNVPLDPGIMAAVILITLAPPSGSNAAIAAMLRLSPKLSLIGTITATMAAPITLPLLGALLGQNSGVSFIDLEMRILPIIGAGWLASYLLLRSRSLFDWLVPEPAAASGISIIGLIFLCFGTMTGVRLHWIEDGVPFLELIGAAIWVSLVLCVIGTLISIRLGLRDAMTVGLMTGTRNVGLAWAAAGDSLTYNGHAYLSAGIMPIFMLPFVMKQISRLVVNPTPQGAVGNALLQWIDNSNPDAIYSVMVNEGDVLRLGRSLDADIRFADRTVSREHAEITIGKDTATMRDVDSRNGVAIDGARVITAELVDGTVCNLGFSRVKFSLAASHSDASEATNPTPAGLPLDDSHTLLSSDVESHTEDFNRG